MWSGQAGAPERQLSILQCSFINFLMFITLCQAEGILQTNLVLAFMELAVQRKEHDCTKLSRQNTTTWSQTEEKSGRIAEHVGRE